MATEKSDTPPAASKQSNAAPKEPVKQAIPPISGTPKPESSSEAEGAEPSKDTGNQPVEVKTETSSSSGE